MGTAGKQPRLNPGASQNCHHPHQLLQRPLRNPRPQETQFEGHRGSKCGRAGELHVDSWKECHRDHFISRLCHSREVLHVTKVNLLRKKESIERDNIERRPISLPPIVLSAVIH
ncbi:hypothetical protein CapIbe_001808 [Capra ibex]